MEQILPFYTRVLGSLFHEPEGGELCNFRPYVVSLCWWIQFVQSTKFSFLSSSVTRHKFFKDTKKTPYNFTPR